MSEAFPPWIVLPTELIRARECKSQGELSFELPFVLPHGVKEGIISVLCTSLSKTFWLILYSVLHNNEQNCFHSNSGYLNYFRDIKV